jgi:hypothetical protein
MTPIKKYNFGFGWFGPLEQCDNGLYCKADEVEALYAACLESDEDQRDQIDELEQDLRVANQQIASYRAASIEAWRSRDSWRDLAIASVALAVATQLVFWWPK